MATLYIVYCTNVEARNETAKGIVAAYTDKLEAESVAKDLTDAEWKKAQAQGHLFSSTFAVTEAPFEEFISQAPAIWHDQSGTQGEEEYQHVLDG